MQLRDHPLMMSGRDVQWPPKWGRINGSRYHEGGILRGEIGTLVEVIPAKIAPFTRCHLLIDFEKVSYLGTLSLMTSHRAGEYANSFSSTSVNRSRRSAVLSSSDPILLPPNIVSFV